MSWSYSGDPSASSGDAVRFMLGDTDSSDPLVTDEEIAWLLDQGIGVEETAARMAEALAAKFARQVSTSVEGVSINASDRATQFRALAAHLRSQSSLVAVPTVGGTDIPRRFTTGMDANDTVEGNSFGADELPDNPL